MESEGIGLFEDILSYLGKSFIYRDNIILFPYIYPTLTDHLTDHQWDSHWQKQKLRSQQWDWSLISKRINSNTTQADQSNQSTGTKRPGEPKQWEELREIAIESSIWSLMNMSLQWKGFEIFMDQDLQKIISKQSSMSIWKKARRGRTFFFLSI